MGCRQAKPKRDLVRLVRTAGGVVLDPTGKASGRGAYFCRDPGCWRHAQSRRSLERALETPITRDDWTRLASGILDESQPTSIIP